MAGKEIVGRRPRRGGGTVACSRHRALAPPGHVLSLAEMAAERGRSSPAAARPPHLASVLLTPWTMKRVMVVEDEVDIRRGIAVALEIEGYEVVEAADGREALQRLRHDTRPDAIVLDLMMPGMNGWQFRDEQRRDPEIADIPVIVVSARPRDSSIPADGYLTKPFALATLFDAIARCAA